MRYKLIPFDSHVRPFVCHRLPGSQGQETAEALVSFGMVRASDSW